MPLDKAERGAIFKSFINREGPQNLGSKKWPSPVALALSGKRFLLTGVMDTITRDDLKTIITQSSGRVMTTMPKQLDYLVAGRDAGPSKLRKAQEQGITVLDEEECYNFLVDKLGEPEEDDDEPEDE